MAPAAEAESPAPKFDVGDRVRVQVRYPIGHCRTPFYFRGAHGVVERYCGTFPNPETSAYRRGGPHIHLYRIRARQVDLWGDYAGSPADTIDVEVYEHWLETEDS